MRFYNTRQSEMLFHVSYLLRENKEKLSKKSPAMGDFIEKYVEMETIVTSLMSKNPHLVRARTMEKVTVRREFVKVVGKLIALLDAAGFTFKGKSLPEMEYSVYQLNKLSAEKLCKAYIKLFAAVKKLRNREYYGLSDGDLRDMEAYYNEFKDIKSAPAVKKKERAEDNKNIEKAIKDCIAFLKKHIDKMMLVAADGEPELQRTYKSLRKVLPRASGRPSDAEVAYRKSRERKKPEHL